MRKIPIVNLQNLGLDNQWDDFNVDFLSTHLEEHNTTTSSLHKHNFFFCVLFTKGRGTHKIDFDTYAIEPGSVFFFRAGQAHYWEFETPPEGYIFSHSRNFYESPYLSDKLNQFPFYRSIKNPPFLRLSRPDIENLEPSFRDLIKEFRCDSIFKRSKILSLVNLIYVDLSRHYISSDKTLKIVSPTYMKIIERFEMEIERHYKEEKSPRFYADMIFISTKHLNRIIRTSLDVTASELIIDRVILEAKRLMLRSENSLTAISLSLGYQDYAYFSRVFKRRTGVSPKKFLAEISR
ncbi:MAG TPA: helix-turn-helix domain-containing protein [Pricia antarctica]|uniref:Helix-turn-helix domain-containing protein n=2 Tax=root TaxID=1 RepID=A0A831QQT0_9FLAO|nr:helix-turn-helix domain-containing protein [Pricia antarctica]